MKAPKLGEACTLATPEADLGRIRAGVEAAAGGALAEEGPACWLATVGRSTLRLSLRQFKVGGDEGAKLLLGFTNFVRTSPVVPKSQRDPLHRFLSRCTTFLGVVGFGAAKQAETTFVCAVAERIGGLVFNGTEFWIPPGVRP